MNEPTPYAFPRTASCSRCGRPLDTGHYGWCGACHRQTRIERQAYAFLDHPRQPWILLDTETTDLKAKDDEVIDLAILSAEGRVLFSSLIRPLAHRVDGSDAQAIHHIRDADLRFAPTFAEVWPTVLPIFTSAQQVITYNARFDRKMLEQSAKLAGITWPVHLSWWCLMDAFAHWYGEELPYPVAYRWQKLALACQELTIDESAFTEEHRALGDAQRAYAVLEALAIRAPEAVGTPFVAALEARRAAHRAREVAQKPSATGFWRAFRRLFLSQGGR